LDSCLKPLVPRALDYAVTLAAEVTQVEATLRSSQKRCVPLDILGMLFDKVRSEHEEGPMSHHYSGVDFGFPLGDARLDFCDLYAFPKPEDSTKSILIMDVHPSKALPEGSTTAEPFAPEAIYELRIDTDEDLLADITYRFQFSPSENGTQTATVHRVEGADGVGESNGGEAVIEGAPVSKGPEARVTQTGKYRFFAGWRSDPFFYDAGGALNDFQFTGDDFFADSDVCSIVLELPNGELGDGELCLWHRTLVPTDDANWRQVERGARTQVVPFLVPNEEKDAYVGSEPADDARFVDVMAHSLEHIGGYSPDEAKRVAGTLLPDVIRYNSMRPVAYPDNGRLLTDDVGDFNAAIFTNGKATEDGVGPHSDLLPEFPYLGPPHEDRTEP
jgi:Domain of unknown function (DUF4331)